MVAAVDRHDGGPGALRSDEDVAIGRPDVVQRFEAGAAEDHVGGVGQHRLAGQRDAEPLADQAAGAVAGDHVVGLDGLASRRSRGRSTRRGHAVVVLDEVHELGVIALRHVRERAREPRQHRIEEILRAALALLRALRRRRLLAAATETARGRAR